MCIAMASLSTQIIHIKEELRRGKTLDEIDLTETPEQALATAIGCGLNRLGLWVIGICVPARQEKMSTLIPDKLTARRR